ncbi:MAG: preprotein translocase subunit SecG, partial [Myxococcales bacterium]|nr:preprotein translocase subunit SecG [Myxococcales bacterium]
MEAALYILFVLNCLFLILVVLLQAGKGDGLAALGGGGSSAGAFLGARGAATFLS